MSHVENEFSHKAIFIKNLIHISTIPSHVQVLQKKIIKKFQAFNDKESVTRKPPVLPLEVIPSSQILNKDVVEKILNGLKELEKEKAFLNPDFSRQFIAERVKSNLTYVSKVINMQTGHSFNHYTNQLRIQYIVKALEADPNLRKYCLDTIAKQAGYSCASSFSRIFKKHQGASPSCFIKELV